jgi:glycosyltransferase involved in cell wall biosynthesis
VIRVLVPYIMTQHAGVRRVLGAGLPRVNAEPGLAITYAELCANHADMDALHEAGVAVERRAGVPGASALSTRTGARKVLDLARHVPRFGRIAARLAERLPEHDVVWLHGHRELLLAVAARAVSPRASPALVWHWHGPPLTLEADAARSAGARWLTRLLAPGCARVVAISGFAAAQARALGVPPERVRVVLNAAAVGPAAGDGGPPLPPRSAGQVTLLVACAALRRHKGVHVAVEALRHLPERYVLWATGDPADPAASAYAAELQALVARAGLAARLHLVGARRDVGRVMAAADVVLVPSIWDEPFGLVAAEAQLLGVPVVASDRGALPELMGGGELGLVARAGDPGDLAAAAFRLGEDPALRGRLAAAARRAAQARYGYDRWAREIAAVLAEAADGSPAVTGDRGCPTPGLAPTRPRW